MPPEEMKCGWILKRGALLKGHKLRWIILQDNFLYYYRNQKSVTERCRRMFDLSTSRVCRASSKSSFKIIDRSGRKYYFKGQTQEDGEMWFDVLSRCNKKYRIMNSEMESDDSAIAALKSVPYVLHVKSPSECLGKSSHKRNSVTNLKHCNSYATPHIPNNDMDNFVMTNRISNPNYNELSRSSSGLSCLSYPERNRRSDSSTHKFRLDPSRPRGPNVRSSMRPDLLAESDSYWVSLENVKDRLRNHVETICTRAKMVDSLVTSTTSDLLRMMKRPDANEIIGAENISGLENQSLSLRGALVDHSNDVKKFYELSSEVVHYLNMASMKCNRQLQSERERNIKLERAVEQLAKQHHALELRVNNEYKVRSRQNTENSRRNTLTDHANLSKSMGGSNENDILQQHSDSTDSSDDITDSGNKKYVFFDAVSDLSESDLPGACDNLSRNNQIVQSRTPTNDIPFSPSDASLNSLISEEDSSGSETDIESFSELPKNNELHKPPVKILTQQSSNAVTLKQNTHTLTKRRTTIPPSLKLAVSLWSLIKNHIGKDLFQISLPINVNEPLSFLQRAAECFQFSHLLDKAAQTKDPYDQMAFVVAFSVAGYGHVGVRFGKPFNPLLGETFEFDRSEDYGWRYISEQVSHHPPGCTQYCESVQYGWKTWSDLYVTTKFKGTKLTMHPKGLFHVQFADGTEYHWTRVTTSVHNIIVGTMWIENSGDSIIECPTNGCSCVLKYHPHSYFGRAAQRRISGYINSPSGHPTRFLQGAWDSHIECSLVENEYPVGEPTLLWKVDPLPEGAADIFHFSQFSIELNELEAGVAPTDSRLRPDQRLMENGLWSEAAEEKRRLEVKQRTKRHEWEQQVSQGLTNEPLYTPVWFAPQKDADGNGIPIYSHNYWQAKEKQDWSKCPDIF